MIQISNVNFETEIILKEESPLTIYLENSNDFYEKVCELANAFNGQETSFTFWENDKQINPDKFGDIITNVFSFDINNKKVQTLLYKKIEENYFFTTSMQELNSLNVNLINLFSNLFTDLPFVLDYKELSLQDLLKTCSVKFQEDYESLLEKIVNYVNILTELKSCKFLILVNVKQVLDKNSLHELYKHCLNEKIALLLIEHIKTEPLFKEERAITITEDLCEILENFEL